MSIEDLEFLKSDLFVKPVIMGIGAGTAEAPAFPVYRENSKKIYIPRFYGIERYGNPSKYEITKGDSINIEFVKPGQTVYDLVAQYKLGVFINDGNYDNQDIKRTSKYYLYKKLPRIY